MSDVNNENKLDYYSILKRRKRTIEGFITEHGIVSLEDLDNVIAGLRKEYEVSDDFRNLAIQALPPAPIPSVLPVEALSDFITEPVLDADVNHVQKPKRRSKKEN